MKGKGWILLLALSGLAESSRGAAEVSNWRVFGTADGLPEDGCRSVNISVNPRGTKVWVQLEKSFAITGLDGYSITNFPSPGSFNSRVYESPSGQLWTVCEDGLKLFKDGNWTQYAVKEIAAELQTRASPEPDAIPLSPVRIGKVIYLLPDALLQFEVERPNVTTNSALRSAAQTKLERFLGMTAASDGGLWISGRRGLAHIPQPVRQITAETEWREFLVPDSIAAQNLNAPVEDEEGGITALAESKSDGQEVVVHFDGQNWVQRPLNMTGVRFAWRDAEKHFWFATTNMLYQLDERNGRAVPYEETFARQYHDLAVEPNGTFWLATSEGLFRFAPPVWRTPQVAENLPSPIRALTDDADGRLWIASANSLFSLQSNQVASFPFPAEFARDSAGARAMFALAGGSIVIDAGDRLLRFNPESSSFDHIAAPPRSRLRAVGLLRDRTLCLQIVSLVPGRETNLLVRFDGMSTNEFPYPAPPRNLGGELRLFSAQSGNVWLSGTKGVARFRENRWQMFTPLDEPMPESPVGMTEFSEERIWCASPDGIRECDGKTWRLIRTGFDLINTMFRARDGSVWVASDSGLARYFRGAWIDNGVDEGLPGSSVRSLCEDSAGRIWAGTARGLSLYHPDADIDPPQTFAESLGGAEGAFAHGATVFISFSAKDKWKATPINRLLYSYRLDDQEWSLYQAVRSASLSALTPGRHYLLVRSVDRNWNVDPRPSLVDFEVILPWYRQSRLLLISSVALIVTIFFAALAFNRHRRLVRSYAEVEAKVALRTKQLEVANRELFHSQKMNALGTLAAGIAHDFNNILSIVKGSAQIIEDNLDNQDKVRVRTGRIKTVVEQGAGIVKAMLGFSRGSGGEITLCDANEVVGETIQLLGDRFLREVEVQFQPAPSLPKVPAYKDYIQQILLNLIFNAAEAMVDHRHVILSASATSKLPPDLVLAPAPAASYVLISIQDYGCGIAPDILPRIFEPFFTTKSMSARRGTGLGLSMVYELARQLEAGLAVASAVDKGSTFTLILPVKDFPVESTPATG